VSAEVLSKSWIVKTYATYVLHLERALMEVEHALSLMNPLKANRPEKGKEWKEERRLAKTIMVSWAVDIIPSVESVTESFFISGWRRRHRWLERVGSPSV
jgi:hypothetical protein